MTLSQSDEMREETGYRNMITQHEKWCAWGDGYVTLVGDVHMCGRFNHIHPRRWNKRMKHDVNTHQSHHASKSASASSTSQSFIPTPSPTPSCQTKNKNSTHKSASVMMTRIPHPLQHSTGLSRCAHNVTRQKQVCYATM